MDKLVSFQKNLPDGLLNFTGRVLSKFAGPCGLRFEELQRFGSLLDSLPDFSKAYGVLRNVWDSPEIRKRIYGPRLLASRPNNVFDLIDDSWDKKLPTLDAAVDFEFNNKMVNDLLLQEDRLSMACGLEVRVPFLDEDLVDLLAKMPAHNMITIPGLKRKLKEAVADWLPTQVINRPKSGFQVPIHTFFNKYLRPLCDKHLSKDRLLQDGLFNPRFVEDVLAARPHYRLRWHYFILYLMIGVNIWQDIFKNGVIFLNGQNETN